MSEKESSTFTNHNFSITHCWCGGTRVSIAFYDEIVAEKCVRVRAPLLSSRCIVEKMSIISLYSCMGLFIALFLSVRLCVYYRSLVKATEFRFDKKSSTSYGFFLLLFSPCVFTILLLC